MEKSIKEYLDDNQIKLDGDRMYGIMLHREDVEHLMQMALIAQRDSDFDKMSWIAPELREYDVTDFPTIFTVRT